MGKIEKTSMLYWYPITRDLPVNSPRTHLIELTKEEQEQYIETESCGLDRIISEIRGLVDSGEFSLPIFIRTDFFSGKHLWNRSCYVDSLDKLCSNLFEVVVGSRCAGLFGLPMRAIAVREYIPMDTLFTAFYGGMPVNPELRFFARDGTIECIHWYWVEDSIKNPSATDWRKRMSMARVDVMGQIADVKKDAMLIAERFSGYWSIDFCRGKDSKWYFIDMAEGEKSWHEESCPYSRGGQDGSV